MKLTKTRLLRSTAAALTSAALALAPVASAHCGAGGGGGGVFGTFDDTAQIEITGTIPGTCTFTTTPTLHSVGQMATGNVTDLGNLGFTCNLATSGAVSLTVKSQNGALKRDGGSETVDYQIAWNIQGSSDVFATIPTSPVPFSLLSGATGVQQLGAYKVKITGPTLGKPAGNYKDIVTYTISP